SGLIDTGMSWRQAMLTIFLGNTIVLLPMLLNAHAGAKYGIPFPVFARASFGVLGSNVPALLRALVACGWFGIQTWIGGTALFAVVGALLMTLTGGNDGWTNAATISLGIGDAAAQPWTMWLSFAIFWALNIMIILWGMEAIKRFESWAAPLLIIVFLALMGWMVIQAGGFGPVVEESGTLGWGPDFWKIFPLSLMGMIAFWSTLSLNMPDFTRFGRSQREQAIGQTLGLPTTMTLFPLVGVLTTSATVIVFGESVWDPVDLTSRLDNPFALVIMLVALALATLSTNVAANVVSPSYDFSNAWPSKISFRTGGIITGILGIIIQPWNLLADANSYIFTWLGTYGGATGAIAGVLIADYWLIRRKNLKLADLYRTEGVYRYAKGWNWIAVLALVVGVVMAIGGANSGLDANGVTTGPFPVDGIIGFLKPFYDYSWVVGLIVSFVIYWLLTITVGRKHVEAQTS
ncbi:MAG: NCS1 family nucleobase:cation symporter-1, partial [Chloroflexi bacterium]|nr:NCS1 family nucleobase:cation symporter-1 [Chloroflexota bacterium]